MSCCVMPSPDLVPGTESSEDKPDTPQVKDLKEQAESLETGVENPLEGLSRLRPTEEPVEP